MLFKRKRTEIKPINERAIEITKANGRKSFEMLMKDPTAMWIVENYADGLLTGCEVIFDVHPSEIDAFEKMEGYRSMSQWLTNRGYEIDVLCDYGGGDLQTQERSVYLGLHDWYEFVAQRFYSQIVEWFCSKEKMSCSTG